MTFHIGLDIGGTKFAGAVFDAEGRELGRTMRPTPTDYATFLADCKSTVEEMGRICGGKATIGIGLPGAIDHINGTVHAPNIPCILGKEFHKDVQATLGHSVAIGNDANCAALSEAIDGAGAEYKIIFAAIMGTGIGGGLIVNRQVVDGPNGMTGEWGHVPLPFREESDGPTVVCGCGQSGCIEKMVCGAGLSRLHKMMTGKDVEAFHIAAQAHKGDSEALRTLDRFYTVVAKALVVLLHTFDPEIIVISGGLNNLPGMYEEVQKRWGQYTICKTVKTKLAPAKHGAMSGLRGAAWLGRSK